MFALWGAECIQPSLTRTTGLGRRPDGTRGGRVNSGEAVVLVALPPSRDGLRMVGVFISGKGSALSEESTEVPREAAGAGAASGVGVCAAASSVVCVMLVLSANAGLSLSRRRARAAASFGSWLPLPISSKNKRCKVATARAFAW